MDGYIGDIRVKTYILDLKSGVKTPFKADMAKDVAKSVLMQMTPEELRTLPKAKGGACENTKSDLEARITGDGRTIWQKP